MKRLMISIFLISLILIPNSGHCLKHDIEGWGGLNWLESLESAKDKIDAEHTQFEEDGITWLRWKKEIVNKNFNVEAGFINNKLVAIILSKEVRDSDRLEAADVQILLKSYISKYGEPTEHQSPSIVQDKYVWVGQSGDLEIELLKAGIIYQMVIMYHIKFPENKVESNDI